MKYRNILQTIGSTPAVRLNGFRDHPARELWVKVESFNPGGSTKARPALNMIEFSGNGPHSGRNCGVTGRHTTRAVSSRPAGARAPAWGRLR
jgi:threonine dehydratase